MLESDLTLIPDSFKALLVEFCSFFEPFFDYLFLPIADYLEAHPNDILNALSWGPGVMQFFETYSFGSVYLGAGLSVILIWNMIKFFIPG